MPEKNPPRPPDSLRRITPKLAELTTEVLFEDVWERKDLSKRDRSLITCAVLTALFRPEQLRFHVGLALANGVRKEELAELITHVAFYAGWPSAVTAAQIADEVINRSPQG
ncbi:MAG TPA: carboxymuconolactone decarboxylase family protein [Steroidobacteraceae bacterium]|nr:carboxymuconolactone decarboxylase family protein [Steroidobacteraceae bacterium]